MNSFDMTAVIAEQHRAQLERQAQQHRQVRAAKAGSHRHPEATPRPRARRWLNPSLRPAA